MKRMMVAMIGAVAISAVGVYAQAKPAEGSTFIGCLVPGSAPDTFVLLNATEKGQKKEKQNYKVTPAEKVDLGSHVTQEVEVTGSASGTGSSQTITVSKIKRRSDYCG